MDARVSRRSFLAAGGVLIVGLGFDGLGRAGAQSIPDADRFLGKSLAPDAVDSFLAVHRNGSVTIFVGRVDLGTGGRIAMRQLAGEELDIPLERIAMIEGDTALTPNQGGTGGSYGIARGGSQLRLAAATARRALLDLAAQRLGRPAADLEVVDGVVRGKDGGGSVTYGELIGDRALNVKVDAAAALKPRRPLPLHRQGAAPARSAREDHRPPPLPARPGAARHAPRPGDPPARARRRPRLDGRVIDCGYRLGPHGTDPELPRGGGRAGVGRGPGGPRAQDPVERGHRPAGSQQGVRGRCG